MGDLVQVERDGPVAIVTLNRPAAMNALSPALRGAIRLAHDIASADPAMIAAFKSLIDDGFALPFGGGMALETARSSAANAAVSADVVEERRRAVMARGREQSA